MEFNCKIVVKGVYKLKTDVGFLKWWDEDEETFKQCSVEMDDYKTIVHFADGSRSEIIIPDQNTYLIDVKSDTYSDIVCIKYENGGIVNAFMLSGNKRNAQIRELKAYYEDLNHTLIERQKNFLKNVNNQFETIAGNKIIEKLVYNYIKQTNKLIFMEMHHFICFERLLYFRFGIGKYTLQTYKNYEHLLTFKTVIESFEDDVDFESLSNELNNMMKLEKILDKRLGFATQEEGVFITWKLLLHEIKHYFYDLFNDEYGVYFSDFWDSPLNEMIIQYTNVDIIDKNSASNGSAFTYFLMYLNKFNDNQNYLECNNILLNKLLDILKAKELDNFESSLMEEDNTKEITISDVDLMTGHEFENFVSYLFHKMGYSSEVTKGSGDQGIDVIAQKNGSKIGIQTKCYSSSVTNKAIQEVVAGLKYYNLRKGIVVTNNFFTDSARELAISNDVILWDRNMLKEKISEFV